MPAPPARVPLSDGTIAHEVSGYLGGLIFLGAMRQAIPVPIPFGPALTRFINDHGEAIERIRALTQQALGLSPGAMAIFDDARLNWPDSVQTADSVAALLCLYSGSRAPFGLDLGDLTQVRRVVQFGVKRQLYGLVEAMTLALAERSPGELSQVSSARRALTEGAALAGEQDPAVAARMGYEAWCVAGLSDYLNPGSAATEEARSRLREVVDQLDDAFGVGEEI
jgi:hypothetical protein